VPEVDVETALRPEIRLSWQRAARSGLDPGARVGSATGPAGGERDSRLSRAAGAVLDDLADRIGDARYALVLADRDARLVDVRCGVPGLRARLERLGAVAGHAFTEATTGTNSIATAFELGRGVAVHGGEHYLEGFKPFTCYGVPIVDPLTRRKEGVLDITCLAEDGNALLGPFLGAAVQEIEARLRDGARRSHRLTLAAFEAAAVRTTGPLVAFGPDLVLSNGAASDLLQPVDHATLQALGRGAVGPRSAPVELASGLRVVATVGPVPDGDGAVLVVLSRADRDRRSAPAVRSGHVGWNASLCHDLRRYQAEGVSVLVEGEPGTGRTTAAGELVRGEPARLVAGAGTVDDVDRACAWLAGQDRGAVLVVEDAHLLRPAVAARVAEMVDRRGLRLVVTSGPPGSQGAPPALIARCPVRLELPPLRSRREQVPAVAAAMLRERSGTGVRLTMSALRTLAAQDWPGNLRELRTVVDYVAGRRSAGDITVADLPSAYRSAPSRPVHGALRQAERDAIVRALADCGGNKVHAARLLGISRTMLYRRLRQFGLAGSQVCQTRTVDDLAESSRSPDKFRD
jgi:transcriptional regulator of acetoin/glycerol metabolism